MIELELHKSVVLTLKANDDLNSLTGGRVWAETPPNNTFPFIFVGDMTIQTSEYDDIFTDVEVVVQAFSANAKVEEILTITGLMRETLNAELAVSGYQVAEWNHVQTIYQNTIDEYKQGIVGFRYKVCKSE